MLNPRQIDPNGEYRPPEHLARPWMFEDQIRHNKHETIWLMIFFVVIITVIVWAVSVLLNSGPIAYALAAGAAVLTFIMTYWSYYSSDQLVLSMSQVTPATREEHPHLIDTLEGLCLAAGMRTVPQCYIIYDPAPNAFATGRDLEHAAVCVTSGLLEKMNRYQIEGVLAHELSHVVNRDTLVQTEAAILVGIVVLLSDWALRAMWYGGGRRRGSSSEGGGSVILLVIALIALVVAPISALLMQMAISRNREYLADASAVQLTRYPEGLASALAFIAADNEVLSVANKATAHLYIANPLADHGGWLNGLFDTHPPIDERIKRLEAM